MLFASMIRRPWMGILVVLLGLVAAGLKAQGAPPPTVVRIASVAFNHDGKSQLFGPAYIVQQQGWLRDQLSRRGIALQWVSADSAGVGQFTNAAFANHRIDFAYYGDLPAIIANASGVPVQAVVAGGLGSNTYLVVPHDSPARSIEDLKGKRIALHRGRPWELSFANLLKTKGLKLSDFRIFNLNPPAGAAALAAGRIDGLFTLSDAYLLADKGVGRILWSSQQAAQDFKIRAELWGAKGFIDQQPALTQLVVDAYLRAIAWASQPAQRQAYLAEQAKSGIPESVLDRETAGLTWDQYFSPLFSAAIRQHYQEGIDYALKAHLIQRSVPSAQLFAPQFVDYALKHPAPDEPPLHWSLPSPPAAP